MVRILTLVSPGSQHACFFSTVAEPIDDPRNPPQPSEPPDFERMAAVDHECGIEFLPPPEGPIESKPNARAESGA
jgi:hypothetical protein